MVSTSDENPNWRKRKKIKIVKDPEDCFILWLLLGKNYLKRLP